MDSHSLAEKKYRQLICENSAELKNFERQLQTAYNRYMLEITIAAKEADRLQNSMAEKVEAKKQAENFRRDEEHMQRMLQEQLKAKVEASESLKWQIIEKERRRFEEYTESKIERAFLDEEIANLKLKEKEEQEKRMHSKLELAKEQKTILQKKEEIRRERAMADAMDDQKLLQMAVDYEARDRASFEERRKYMEARETLKERVAQQLDRLMRLQQEYEKCHTDWQIAERQKAEKEKWEIEKEMKQFRKMQIKRLFEEGQQLDTRRREKEELKQQDLLYAESVKRNIELDKKIKHELELKKRKEKEHVKEENKILLKLREERKSSEQQEELQAMENLKTERKKQQAIIEQERLCLLKSLPPDIIACLPPGCISEEDLLLLNIPHRENVGDGSKSMTA